MLIHLLTNHPSFFSVNNNNSINVKSENYKVLFGWKKSRRINKVVDKDSEFEVDPDEAREALRKLDQQLQSLSSKQPTSPKIRGPNYNQLSSQIQEEGSEISGSFWSYGISLLLLFSIFYNIFFITIIKPSVDGPEPVGSSEAYDMK